MTNRARDEASTHSSAFALNFFLVQFNLIRILPIFLLIAASVFSATKVGAEPIELACTMSSYTGSGAKSKIRMTVPTNVTHEIDGGFAKIKGSNIMGSATFLGNNVIIKYIDYDNHFWPRGIEMKYSYSRKSGAVTVRTEALWHKSWSDGDTPRSGIFSIKGRCKIN